MNEDVNHFHPIWQNIDVLHFLIIDWIFMFLILICNISIHL
jgi:hypothetical protein